MRDDKVISFLKSDVGFSENPVNRLYIENQEFADQLKELLLSIYLYLHYSIGKSPNGQKFIDYIQETMKYMVQTQLPDYHKTNCAKLMLNENCCLPFELCRYLNFTGDNFFVMIMLLRGVTEVRNNNKLVMVLEEDANELIMAFEKNIHNT